ncbi:MAG: bifunctional 5,10-methylenetetrahydrofolate dehydrogenase/5,10-methenyltetrahydrofolate cyclohydrolase [Chloroflexota bacterium]|nr:bifunctional 5,10-methylenetetrahydrofolate dehydrogenase/5,10-methenyltetrahydrofolate cyclohydrolase [Chloroflexota bacterium]MDQ5865307.1 bifunctional 5,10-methylenetetrahydrofolate dehydrogenase/5,10-methenyltetrahydrofolate cyclohydrolase [Chloroflexota bacterium]
MTDTRAEQDTEVTPTPLLLDGRTVAREMREQYAREAAALKAKFGLLPGLGVLRVGADPASISYTGRISKAFAEVGIGVTIHELHSGASRAMLQAEVGRMNVLPEIAGIIVQMPLPPHIGLDALVDVLNPDKDVDGLHPVNVGNLSLGLEGYVPATPAGGMALLDYYGIKLEGLNAVVVGRSGVVGRPLAQLLLARNATVTIAHSHTRHLEGLVSQADLVATAVGKPEFIRGDCIKPGAIVLDFGASIVEGHMTGDVQFEPASARASAITPVPGGTGPMTNAMLLRNTLQAIKRYFGVTS